MVPEKQKEDVYGSPIVFWDSFGFSDTHSGINRYAKNLMGALKPLGIQPILLGDQISSQLDTLDVGPANLLEQT